MRVLSLDQGVWRHTDGLDRAAIRDLALGPQPVWIRSEGESQEEWESLAEWFDLHPLAIEDASNARQRPKVEDYEGELFMVVRYPRTGDTLWSQVGIFLGEGFVLTASREDQPILDPIEAKLLAGGIQHQTVDHVAYSILDTIVDAYFPFVDDIEESLDDLDDEIIQEAGEAQLAAIRDLKRLLGSMRKVVPPMRDAVTSLERGKHLYISDEVRIYLRDVTDHMVRIHERIEHLREMSLVAQDMWNASLAHRQADIGIQQNQVMKRLTVIAALLLVPSLIAGIGGMNFPGAPSWSFWHVTAALLAAVAAGVALALWKKWL